MASGNLLKGFMVICGSLEIMLFGGIIFGWASLVYIYKDEGYFSHLCVGISNQTTSSNVTSASPPTLSAGSFGLNSSGIKLANSSTYGFNLTTSGRRFEGNLTCKEQDNQFNLIFSIATVVTGIMCFVNGYLYDRFGTRVCRIIAMWVSPAESILVRSGRVCFLGAMACLILASPEHPVLLYPGATLLVYGGYLILVTNLQLANLIPRFRSTIMSLYAGSYDCSAVIFLVFKAAHEAGLKVNTCFLIQACSFSVFLLISTFLTLPKYHLPWPMPDDFEVNPPVQRLCSQDGESKTTTEDNEIESPGNEMREKVSLDLDDNKNENGPCLNASKNSTPRASPARSIRPPGNTLNVRRLRESELMSSQNCLLAINHVPWLSTSMLYSSSLSVNKRRRHMSNISTALRNKPNSRTPHHHLSLLSIPRIKRTISREHRSSVSLSSENYGNNLAVPSRGLTPQNTPRTSGRLSAQPGGSPFLSLHSVAAVSAINIAVPDDLEKDQQDDKVHVDTIKMERKTSFRKEVLSPLFIMEVMWMSFQRIRSWFFVGVFNPWITTMANGDLRIVSYYTSVFAAMQFFGIFTAPMSGRLMDRKPGKKYQYNNPKFERLHAAIPSFLLNCTVVVLLSIGAAIPVLEVQYVTFALHVLNRSFIYGPNSAFVANAFPFEYFGILLGTTLTLSAIFGMIQYPLFLIIQGPLNDDPLIVNIVLIVLMMVTYAHPAYIWIYLRRKLKKQDETLGDASNEPLKADYSESEILGEPSRDRLKADRSESETAGQHYTGPCKASHSENKAEKDSEKEEGTEDTPALIHQSSSAENDLEPNVESGTEQLDQDKCTHL